MYTKLATLGERIGDMTGCCGQSLSRIGRFPSEMRRPAEEAPSVEHPLKSVGGAVPSPKLEKHCPEPSPEQLPSQCINKVNIAQYIQRRDLRHLLSSWQLQGEATFFLTVSFTRDTAAWCN